MARWALASFEQVQVLDLTLTNPALKGFIAGFHDGTYGYAVPYYNGAHYGKVALGPGLLRAGAVAAPDADGPGP